MTLFTSNSTATNYRLKIIEGPYSWSRPIQINNSGEVIMSSQENGVYSSWIWSEEKGVKYIGDGLNNNPGLNTYNINNLGQVVGWETTSTGATRPFIWSEETGMRNLNNLLGQSCGPTGINDRSQVIGGLNDGSDFIWSEVEGLKILGKLDEYNNASYYLENINNLGQVVGYIGSTDNGFIPFLWSYGSVTQLCPNFGIASDINNLGQIVGVGKIEGFAGPEFYGFLWLNGQMYNLNDIIKDENAPNPYGPIEFGFAKSINDYGDIVGTYDEGIYVLFNEDAIRNAVPEPSAMILFSVLGLPFLAKFKKRS